MNKRILGLVMGLAAVLLQIPGFLMVFSGAGEWSLAATILTALMIAAVALAILGAICSITGNKKTSALFLFGGIAGAVTFALLLYLLMSFESVVITSALSAIILFAAARILSGTRA